MTPKEAKEQIEEKRDFVPVIEEKKDNFSPIPVKELKKKIKNKLKKINKKSNKVK